MVMERCEGKIFRVLERRLGDEVFDFSVGLFGAGAGGVWVILEFWWEW